MKHKWLGLRIDTEEVELIPRFYGGAWIDYPSRTVVNVLLPFNIPASIMRQFYIYLIRGFVYRDPTEDEIQRRAQKLFHEWQSRVIKLAKEAQNADLEEAETEDRD